jgi:hypothetical protein
MEQSDVRVKAWPIAKAAWGGVARAFVSAPITFIVTIALYAALGAAMNGVKPLPKLLFRPEAIKTTWTNGAIYTGMHLGVVLVSTLILAPMLVSVHRTLLKDRVRAGWGAAWRNYTGWLFALTAAALLAACFALLASAVGFVRGLIDFIVLIFTLVLAARLALLPPAIAIGVPEKSTDSRIDSSWMGMEGRFWLFMRVLLMTLVPMLVLLAVLNRIGLPKPPNPPPISPPDPAPPPVTHLLIIGRALHGAVEAFAAALIASATSALYARLKPKG